MNFRISGQKIKVVNQAKYLAVKLDEILSFKKHIDSLKGKLCKANCILAKL